MFSLENKKIIDLTAELVSRVRRLDGTVEEGTRDVYGMPWIVEESINERDGTMEHLVGCNRGTVADWPIGGLSGHMGTHIQLGVGHNDNWAGTSGRHAGHMGRAAQHLLRRSLRVQARPSQGPAHSS